MDEGNGGQLVRIDLTPSQAQVVKDAIGREATSIELTVAELEQRIVPDGVVTGGSGGVGGFRLALNGNETLLA